MDLAPLLCCIQKGNLPDQIWLSGGEPCQPMAVHIGFLFAGSSEQVPRFGKTYSRAMGMNVLPKAGIIAEVAKTYLLAIADEPAMQKPKGLREARRGVENHEDHDACRRRPDTEYGRGFRQRGWPRGEQSVQRNPRRDRAGSGAEPGRRNRPERSVGAGLRDTLPIRHLVVRPPRWWWRQQLTTDPSSVRRQRAGISPPAFSCGPVFSSNFPRPRAGVLLGTLPLKRLAGGGAFVSNGLS